MKQLNAALVRLSSTPPADFRPWGGGGEEPAPPKEQDLNGAGARLRRGRDGGKKPPQSPRAGEDALCLRGAKCLDQLQLVLYKDRQFNLDYNREPRKQLQRQRVVRNQLGRVGTARLTLTSLCRFSPRGTAREGVLGKCFVHRPARAVEIQLQNLDSD